MRKVVVISYPCLAYDMLRQRIAARGIHCEILSTESDEHRILLSFLSEHNVKVRDYPLTALYISGVITQIWSGLFDVSELLELV